MTPPDSDPRLRFESEKLRVVVVDDDPVFLEIATALVEDAGALPFPFASSLEAMNAIGGTQFDAVLTDYRLDGELTGEDLVRGCLKSGSRTPIAVMSVVDSSALAARLVKLGADDYLLKGEPPNVFRSRLNTFLERARIERSVRDMLRTAPGRGDSAMRVLGQSAALRPLLSGLPRAAKSGATVLVRGESGSGKELAARAVHELSARAKGLFIAVDCGAIPETLIENELFGHKKGAYSDAKEDREGLVQRAHGGTLFLDEVGELPLSMQAKLLRFLQTREFRRLGDPAVTIAEVRVVAATHRDLRKAVREGRFRQDLYYRLAVLELRIPPLRDRLADVPVLASAFLHRYAAEFESPALAFSPEALDALQQHPWPGNVRELENAVQRIAAMATRPLITAEEVFTSLDPVDSNAAPSLSSVLAPPFDSSHTEIQPFHEAKQALIDNFERAYAKRVLHEHHGNVSAAARAAGLDRKSLSRLLARHGLEVSDLLEDA